MVIPKQATVSDRYFLGWTKSWMKDEIQETLDKVNEALHPVTQPLRRKRLTNPFRQKRQVMIAIGAATLGAVAGSIITEFSSEGINDVLEKKEHVLVSTVEDNLMRINQDRRDIENLKKTLAMIIDDTKRYIMDTKRNTYGVTHLQVVMTIQQACQSLKDAIDTIESARIGEFMPSMVDHKGLVKALKRLRNKAVMKGYEPSIEASTDMKHLPCTTVVKEEILYVVVHVPLYQSSLDLDLFRYIDHPVQKLNDGLYASIDLEGEPTFLGINRDESKYKEFSAGDLEACYQRNKRYFCADVPLYSKSRPHCLWGLYKHHEAQVKEQCKITLSKVVARAVCIDEDRFMITDTDGRNELTLGCNDEVPQRDRINGTKVVSIKRGCRASTTHVSIHHPAYEPEVTIEGVVINDELVIPDWVPRDDNNTFLKTASKMLEQLGRKIDWKDVATLTTFRARMAAASLTFPSFGTGVKGWLMHLISPVLTAIFVIALIYVIVRCVIPALVKWRNGRQQIRAQNILNPRPQVLSKLAEGEEPMEVDDDYNQWAPPPKGKSNGTSTYRAGEVI